MRRTRLRPKSSREREKSRLDALFRPWVLLRAGYCCERCGKAEGSANPRKDALEPFIVLQVAHFKSRRFETTRWHPLNVAVLCKGCHFLWAHSEPDQFKKWWGRRIGESGFEVLNRLLKLPNSVDLGAMERFITGLGVAFEG